MSPVAHRPLVGIVGGGQLARMTYDASLRLDVDVAVLAGPDDEATLGHVPDVTVADQNDERALHRFAARCDVVTFDHEKVAPDAVTRLERAGHVVRPGRRAFAAAADKSAQRPLLHRLGLPVPAFTIAHSLEEVTDFGERHGWPIVAKRARGGYDGRGVLVIDDPGDVGPLVLPWLATPGAPVVVEPYLPIQRELAVIVARRPGGQLVIYPVLETRQDGAAICREVQAPAPIERRLARAAHDLAVRVSTGVDAVGILAVELFVVAGRLVVNELAARPHNTGHLTIEACITSQFENHLRAVLDLPLGPTRLTVAHATMANVIALGDIDLGPADAGAGVHLYGKRSRRGRKVGHVTVTGEDPDDVQQQAGACARDLAERTLSSARGRVAS